MLKATLVCIYTLGSLAVVCADSDVQPFSISSSKNESSNGDTTTIQAEVISGKTDDFDEDDTDDSVVSYDPPRNDSLKTNFQTDQSQDESIDYSEEDFVEDDNIVCTSPPEIEGAISPLLEGNEYALGTVISYQCPFGHVSRSSGTLLSVCRINKLSGKAEWTHPVFTCIPRSCGDPGYVSNGRRIGNLFTFPNKVEFECLDGYKLRGLKARYCQAGGEWSGKLPTCERVYCSVPTNPVNGRVRYDSLEYGTELEYKCNKGFMLANDQPRFCSQDGKWSNHEPECIETRCKNPKAPEHGSVQLSDGLKVGSLALYSCNNDDALLFGASTSKCLSSGDWTFDPPKCLSSCEIVAVPDGELGYFRTHRASRYNSYRQFVAFQIGGRVKHGESVIVNCKNGYAAGNQTKDNTAEVICNDGKWSAVLHCLALSCFGDPPPIENGRPMVDKRTHGSTIWYKCDKNYDKSSFGNVSCSYGIWKGPTPVCSDTRCNTDRLNYPGLIVPGKTTFFNGGRFTVTCDYGYRKSVDKILCREGQWVIENNPCTIVKCEEEPPYIANGRIGEFDRSHGSVVKYECEEGFIMSEDSSIRCDNGKWEGKLPVCEESIRRGELSSTSDPWHSTTESTYMPMSWNLSLPVHQEECFCVYDYRVDLITAFVRNRILEGEAKIKKGETVSFVCHYPGTDLVWPNDLRLHGGVNLTCDTCQIWNALDLPICDSRQSGDSAIMFSNNIKILPGGAIEVPKNERISVQCTNEWAPPTWSDSYRRGVNFGSAISYDQRGRRLYIADMNISHVDDEHVGRYQCFLQQGPTYYRATNLDLQIATVEVQCPELQTNTNRGKFIIQYENNRKVHSRARYTCVDRSQIIAGTSERTCLIDGKWSGSYPRCEDVLCPVLPDNDIFLISYSNQRKISSVALYYCRNIFQKLIGSKSRTCLQNGEWQGRVPQCVNITCVKFTVYNGLAVSYTNDNLVNSVAAFRCRAHLTLVGSERAVCQFNGTWSHPMPNCENLVTCKRFEIPPGLEVSYTDDVRIGSVASFRCSLSSSTLVGSSSAVCRDDGTWSDILPFCGDPDCPIDALMTLLPEGVFPDIPESAIVDMSHMPDVTDVFVAAGSELRLECEENLILLGSSKATCGSRGRWEYGNVQCVPGCRLIRGESSLLIVEPVKEYYRFGEFILLSCPPGQRLTSDVERLMCLNRNWSHDIPDCVELKETSPSESRATTKKAVKSR